MAPIQTQDPKTQRFEGRFTPDEHEALKRLADRAGVSMADVLRSLVRREAKRRKVWNGQ